MSKPKMVQVEKDGIAGEVTEESLKAWERNGWTRVDDGDSETEVQSVARVPQQTQPRTAPTEAPKADETKKEQG